MGECRRVMLCMEIDVGVVGEVCVVGVRFVFWFVIHGSDWNLDFGCLLVSMVNEEGYVVLYVEVIVQYVDVR